MCAYKIEAGIYNMHNGQRPQTLTKYFKVFNPAACDNDFQKIIYLR